MPNEYEALVAALKLTDIPFAEYGWRTRPEGAYGVISLEMEADQLNGDGAKLDRVWEGSIDLYYQKLSDRTDLIEAVEEAGGKTAVMLADGVHSRAFQKRERGLQPVYAHAFRIHESYYMSRKRPHGIVSFRAFLEIYLVLELVF